LSTPSTPRFSFNPLISDNLRIRKSLPMYFAPLDKMDLVAKPQANAPSLRPESQLNSLQTKRP
jgi:hypothetical protein